MNAAIWNNKTCRIKQLTQIYIGKTTPLQARGSKRVPGI